LIESNEIFFPLDRAALLLLTSRAPNMSTYGAMHAYMAETTPIAGSHSCRREGLVYYVNSFNSA